MTLRATVSADELRAGVERLHEAVLRVRRHQGDDGGSHRQKSRLWRPLSTSHRAAIIRDATTSPDCFVSTAGASSAATIPATRNGFKRYHANTKVASLERAIPPPLWPRCDGELEEWPLRSYGGFDLGRSDDWAAAAVIAKTDETESGQPIWQIKAQTWCARTSSALATGRSSQESQFERGWRKSVWTPSSTNRVLPGRMATSSHSTASCGMSCSTESSLTRSGKERSWVSVGEFTTTPYDCPDHGTTDYWL